MHHLQFPEILGIVFQEFTPIGSLTFIFLEKQSCKVVKTRSLIRVEVEFLHLLAVRSGTNYLTPLSQVSHLYSGYLPHQMLCVLKRLGQYQHKKYI